MRREKDAIPRRDTLAPRLPETRLLAGFLFSANRRFFRQPVPSVFLFPTNPASFFLFQNNPIFLSRHGSHPGAAPIKASSKPWADPCAESPRRPLLSFFLLFSPFASRTEEFAALVSFRVVKLVSAHISLIGMRYSFYAVLLQDALDRASGLSKLVCLCCFRSGSQLAFS